MSGAILSQAMRLSMQRSGLQAHSRTATLMRADGAVRLVGFGLQNLLDLLNDQLKLFVFGVEMRRDANACAGAVVNQKIAAQQLLGHRLTVQRVNDDCAAALIDMLRTTHRE